MGAGFRDDPSHPLANKPSLAPPIANHPKKQENGIGSMDGPRVPPPWSTAANPPWSTATRPLSDIRELTEPSLAEYTNRYHELGRRPSLGRKGSISRQNSIGKTASLSRKNSLQHSARHARHGSRSTQIVELDINQLLQSGEQTTDASSAYSLQLHDVPPRTSSRTHKSLQRTASISREKQPLIPTAPPRGVGYTIPHRGRSQSPVRKSLNEEMSMPRLPSRTFMRTDEPNFDVLDFPKHQHPRINLELHVAASLFVGGGSVEGHVRLVLDDLERIRHRRQLAISRVSIDFIGVEEMSKSKRNIFLNLATELISSDNPPPHNMVESLKQISPLDPFWLLAPSISHLPFLISLPLDVGPPPFQSKHARIRYLLCATALIRDQGKQYLVRSCQEISVLSVYDPEKALMSLPSPLTSSDEYVRHRENGLETIKVTAGLHRQVWVSGTNIFVDIHIANMSRKTVKRLELQLERDILCYKHAAASTQENSASQARIFDSNEKTILSKFVMKQGSCGWSGVPSDTNDTRTCDLELPRGHATVKCGKFFEVRFFLNAIVSASHNKVITVQLPIVLIHMSSLDVVPNSVAQVAAAIEEKRAAKISHKRNQSARLQPHGAPSGDTTTLGPQKLAGSPSKITRRPSTTANTVQGRAFAAPRKQSLDKIRHNADNLAELESLLKASPRKHKFYSQSPRRLVAGQVQPHQSKDPDPSSDDFNYQTPPSNRKGRVLSDDLNEEVAHVRSLLRRMRSVDTQRSHSAHPLSTRKTSSIRRKGSAASRASSAGAASSSSYKVGFREMEGDEDSPTGRGEAAERGPGAGRGLSRWEGLSAASARTKMRSKERWKGGAVGLFRGERRAESREREREREQHQRMMLNWI